MTDTQQHPLEPALAARIDRYLDDLGRMLAVASPVDRADALGSVREHIDDALGTLDHPATDADITAILEQLGSPEDVAAGLIDSGIVTPGAGSQPAPAVTGPSPAAPGDGRATGALVAGIAAILLPVIGLGLGIVALVVARSARRSGTNREAIATAGAWLGGIAIALHVAAIIGLISVMTLRTSGPTGESPLQEVVETTR